MAELFDAYERALRRKGVVEGGLIKISGAGSIAGGTYEAVHIAGSGTVRGDLSAKEVRVAGSASFQGSVSAEEVSVSGTASVQGDVKASVFKAAGSLTVRGSLEASGSLRVAGALRAARVRAPEVRISGGFEVDEVEGDLVELELSGGSRAALIRGGEVRVRRAEGGLASALLGRLLKLRGVPELEVGRIEARAVLVEDVLVRGDVKAERVEIAGQGEVEGRVEGEVVRRKHR
jgi:cytoskeletal protein CcmA (bactofilin family)